MSPTTIGLDLAKSVFQVHGVDGAGAVVITKKLRRAEVLRFFGSLERKRCARPTYRRGRDRPSLSG